MTYNYHLSFGSNIEPRTDHLKNALEQLHSISHVIRKSGLYQTAPWGFSDQPAFYNAVVEVETDLDPHQFIKALKKIEKAVGRKTSSRWGPREIDIDIICANVEVHDDALQIPHHHFASRRFVLAPMAELNNDFTIEPGGRTISTYLSECDDASNVEKLDISW